MAGAPRAGADSGYSPLMRHSTVRLSTSRPLALPWLLAVAACGSNPPPGGIPDAAFAGPDLAMPAGCTDGKKSGDETDLDCGGSCAKCADGKACAKGDDCKSGVCEGGMCKAPSCTDRAKNGDETDVDCGGSCPKCAGGKGCAMNTDCQTNMCNGGKCAAGPLMLGKSALYTVGKNPWGLVTGDFNGDKKIDVGVSSADGLCVLLGNGDGTLGNFVAYGTTSIAGQPAAADFNKDGHLDVVWPDFNTNNVNVILGKGDGTFMAPKVIKVAGGPGAAAVGDVDGDSRPDIVLSLEIANAVAVMTGNGDGTFGTPASYPSAGTNAVDLAIADLNGDGKQDIAVLNSGTDWMNGNQLTMGGLSTLLNKGNGTFAAANKLYDLASPIALAVSDLDGDGKPDFVTSDVKAGKVFLSLAGAAPTAYGSGKNPWGLAIGDLTLDGKPDVVVPNGQSNQVSVLANKGGGVLDAPAAFPLANPNPGRVALADLNGDGRLDLLVVNYLPVGVFVLLNTTM